MRELRKDIHMLPVNIRRKESLYMMIPRRPSPTISAQLRLVCSKSVRRRLRTNMIDLWLRSARVSSSSNILFSSPQSGQNTPVMLHPRYLVRASRRDCLHILTCPLSTQKIRMSCVLLLSLDTTAPSFPIYMDSESLAEVVVCRERTMTL